MAEELIAVTGATGQIGGRVATALANADRAQRLLVREPSRAPDLPGTDVRTIAGYGAGDEVRRAL
jgi:NAD(P)H dehydrogenase (quinone)